MRFSGPRPSPTVVRLLLWIGSFAVAGSETMAKPAGPLGIWGPSDGRVYQAPDIPESTNVQAAFAFGDFWIANAPAVEGHTFRQWIEKTCDEWRAERVIGVILPVTEGGVVNAPGDTALYEPDWPAGMIQGAARFSRLSRIHGQIGGIAIDDFAWPDTGRVRDLAGLDTASIRDIRDALKGKYVDVRGIVHHDTPETTPHLKLLVVVYADNNITPEYLPLIDGVSLWLNNQNVQYGEIDGEVDHCRAAYAGKEVDCGIYVSNSVHGWMSPASLEYMYRRLLDRYDDGDVNGMMLFAGHWIVLPNITRERWDANRLPALLDEVYYPFVGAGHGRVLDGQGQPVEGAAVSCATIGRVSGDLLVRSRKRTDAEGRFDFSAWAGNRSTDSSLYFLVAEKAGWESAPVSGWIHRGGVTAFPDLRLSGPVAATGEFAQDGVAGIPSGIEILPNPLRESAVIRYSVRRGDRLRLRVLDATGREVGRPSEPCDQPGVRQMLWDGRGASGDRVPSGVYFIRLEDDCGRPRASGRLVLTR